MPRIRWSQPVTSTTKARSGKKIPRDCAPRMPRLIRGPGAHVLPSSAVGRAGPQASHSAGTAPIARLVP